MGKICHVHAEILLSLLPHTYVRMYYVLCTYIHAYIQTYIRTYIHTYVHWLTQIATFTHKHMCAVRTPLCNCVYVSTYVCGTWQPHTPNTPTGLTQLRTRPLAHWAPLVHTDDQETHKGTISPEQKVCAMGDWPGPGSKQPHCAPLVPRVNLILPHSTQTSKQPALPLQPSGQQQSHNHSTSLWLRSTGVC